MKIRKKLFNLFNSTKFETDPDSSTLILSNYSSMPRFYTINGIKYDIDNPIDIKNIPLFGDLIEINGQTYGMDSILRKHAAESYLSNKNIYNAAIEKEAIFKEHGFYYETAEENALKKERQIAYVEREQKEAAEKIRHDAFTIKDMQQFSDIPFDWHFVMNLKHTNGIAWFMLNKNNQYIALSIITFINDTLANNFSNINFNQPLYICTENIDFDYPSPMNVNSVANTYVECIPYTKTGRISKYPAILHFKEFPEKYNYGKYFHYAYSVYGDIYFMSDGNIGRADLTINKYQIQLRLKGLNLTIRKIDHTSEYGRKKIYFDPSMK